ncbi:coniferyl aldehyde dehydrogenase [Ferrimonas sp. SCSIO 43195]|uniref:coniferyl aldehyde dehydrogenase n=2 Tax=Ferrimonas TaxID=44011 RepID=UPI000413756F|nr:MULTISPECIES: coniferyl aldehyde dehydrogenase [Ferrimonas]USD38096.1 coniferyl aldehyde dehydrogenase [Ferrimonas sp. SCSIO 43195]
MTEQQLNQVSDDHQRMLDRFAQQRAAFQQMPMPSVEARIHSLQRLKAALLAHKDRLCEALNQDYDGRSTQDTLISDILPCIMNIKYSCKRLKKWARPERRHAGLLLSPAKVEVHYQPLGVVGIVVPWNFPVMLSLGPLITAIAAGNRAMVKLSEFTPHTNAVLVQMLASAFDHDEVACIEGDAKLAAQFTSLPFDHLLFTGSTNIGRHVMHAAADNLTPVTLELGGKSPVIVGPDVDIDNAVERMSYGKCLNAGQICVAPDYVLVPRDKLDDFVSSYQKNFSLMYPKGVHSRDYGSVINDRQYQRLLGLLEDATAKGATAIPCAEGQHRDDSRQRLTTHLLLNTTEEMTVLQEEIFGPLLPVIPYDSIDDALDYIRHRPRPLALYLLSYDKVLQQKVISETHAGGMCINDALFHVAADDAPFGGIGPSGMGHYHGIEGFKTFSKAKTVLTQGKFSSGILMHPPYGKWIQTLIFKLFLR